MMVAPLSALPPLISSVLTASPSHLRVLLFPVSSDPPKPPVPPDPVPPEPPPLCCCFPFSPSLLSLFAGSSISLPSSLRLTLYLDLQMLFTLCLLHPCVVFVSSGDTSLALVRPITAVCSFCPEATRMLYVCLVCGCALFAIVTPLWRSLTPYLLLRLSPLLLLYGDLSPRMHELGKKHSFPSDAAWNPSTLDSGLGWLIKNRNKEIVNQGSATRRFTPSALAAEALAVKEALTAATRMEFTSITVFSDSQVLISLLKTETSTNELQGVLIFLLSNLFSSINYRFVSRNFNSQADALSKSALASISVIPS